MEAKTKFKHKRNAKKYSILTWICIILAKLSFLGIFVYLFIQDTPNKTVLLSLFISIILFVIVGVITSTFYQLNMWNLTHYKSTIEKWRKEHFSNYTLHKGLEIIDSGDMKSAIDFFLANHLKMEDEQEYFLYYACIFKGLESKNPEIVERAKKAYNSGLTRFKEKEEKLNELLNI